MTTPRIYNVLFLCTGNSARSIFGEVLLNRLGRGRFHAFSAGSHPRGEVHPLALQTLREFGESTEGLRSKGWDKLAEPDSVPLDFVFTVCGNAAAERCPVWPGQPISAHWGVEDPASVEGPEAVRMVAFRSAYRQLETRIKLFCSLRFELLERMALQRRLEEIGRSS
jgi:arsenate reductase